MRKGSLGLGMDRRDIWFAHFWFSVAFRVWSQCEEDLHSYLLRMHISMSLPMLLLGRNPDIPKSEAFLWQNSKMLKSISPRAGIWGQKSPGDSIACSLPLYAEARFGIDLDSVMITCLGKSQPPHLDIILNVSKHCSFQNKNVSLLPFLQNVPLERGTHFTH